jgi:hypothetical protein
MLPRQHTDACRRSQLQVKVTTVDGPVELKIPAGTQPGTTLLMAKRGVPRLGTNNQVRGNHNVSARVCGWRSGVRASADVGVARWSLERARHTQDVCSVASTSDSG